MKKTLAYVVAGTVPWGARYLRFPQGEQARTLLLLYPDGSAGLAPEGVVSKKWPAGSGEAEAVKDMFAKWDEGNPTAILALFLNFTAARHG